MLVNSIVPVFDNTEYKIGNKPRMFGEDGFTKEYLYYRQLSNQRVALGVGIQSLD